MEYSGFFIDTLCPFFITAITSTLVYFLCVEAKRELYRVLGALLFSLDEINNNPEKLEYYVKTLAPRRYI